MSNPFVGEIRLFGFGRVPQGWLACDGSLVAIAQYDVLYSLLGTTYGGDGQVTFAMPDLRGRVPVHQGQGPGLSSYLIGQVAGDETVSLTPSQIPTHGHALVATTAAATSLTPGVSLLPGAVSGDTFYVDNTTAATAAALSAQSISNSGGASLPHENTMPTLTVQPCIAYAGIYPSQS